MSFTRQLLFCCVILLLPALLVSIVIDTCELTTRCPALTETPGYTDAYCTEVTEDLECLGVAILEGDCAAEQTAIQTRIDSSTAEYSDYRCGVAGLTASTMLCVVISLVSLALRG